MRSFGATTSWRHLFFVLLVLLIAQASESIRQIIPIGNGDPKKFDEDDHIDHETLLRSLFYDMNDMKAGKRKAIFFAKKEESISGPFIPRATAESIPFSLKELPEILRLFNISPGSALAAAVEVPLWACEKPPASEVFKSCFTSFDSMLESVRGFFGNRHRPRIATTVFRGSHVMRFQNYTVSGPPREVATPKMIGCHALAYPYAVFYCHVQPGETKVFEIPLVGDDGTEVDAVSACHLDTSQWDADNRSFLALGSRPGRPVCHFFPPYDNFAWVHAPPATSTSATN